MWPWHYRGDTAQFRNMTTPVLIDEYSLAAFPTEPHFGGTKLSTATAFAWDQDGEIYLITNWHNVSGKNAETGKHLSPTAAEPDQLRVWWNTKGQIGNKTLSAHALRDADGKPLWLEHPMFGRTVDVIALPVKLPAMVDPRPINKMPAEKLRVTVGMDVYVLGFPFDFGATGFPAWKRGSLASEPGLLPREKPVLLVDTASRPGMSGSPVIMRSWGTAHFEDGSTGMGNVVATRIIGVYSGRLNAADPLDAQLGLVWPIKFVEEILKGGVAGSVY